MDQADCLEHDDEQKYLIALWSMNNNPSGILWTALDGDIRFANYALCTMTGYSGESLENMNLLDLDMTTKSTDIGEAGHLTQLVRNGEITHLSSAFKNADGDTFPVQIAISSPACAGRGFVCFVQDVSKIIALENALSDYAKQSSAQTRKLQREAETDYLTGTWLRRHFFEVVSNLTEKTNVDDTPLSLLMIDVDHFKEINDGLGHNAGDRVLKELVGIIVSNVRAEDYLFRWGGDEFVIIMPGMDLQGAEKAADRLREAVRDHRFTDAPPVTASIGVAQYRRGEDVIGGWMSRADFAMYRAKSNGRDAVHASR